MKRRALALLLVLVAGPALHAQTSAGTASARVSPNAIRAYLRFLSDDALEGRGTGTRGGLVAAKFIAAQFRRMGLEPAGDSDSYLQTVPLLAKTPTPTLSIAGTPLRYPADYVVAPVSDDSLVKVAGDIVFAGYGIESPARQWDDYKDADVRGRVVVVLPGDPDSTVFDRFTGRPWSAVREKADVAARHGAAALLVVQSEGRGGIRWTAVEPLTRERVALPAPAGAVAFWGWLNDSAAATLAAGGGRSLEQLRQAAARRDFRPVPLGARLEAEIRTAARPVTTYNVVAKLAGRGSHAEEAVVIGAHYDHLGIGAPVNGDSIYNGAEDNASGTAAVLATAEALAASGVRPARTIVFAAFAAEELGMQGSDWLVRHPPAGLRFVGAFAMDVLNLYGRTRDIGTVGVDQSSLGQLIRQAAAAEKMRIHEDPDDLHRGRFFRSDNYAFARQDIPAIRIVNGVDFVGRPPDWGREQRARYWDERYHGPNDQFAPWMSMDGIAQQARVLVRAAVAAADADRAPSWAAGSDFRPPSGAGR